MHWTVNSSPICLFCITHPSYPLAIQHRWKGEWKSLSILVGSKGTCIIQQIMPSALLLSSYKQSRQNLSGKTFSVSHENWKNDLAKWAESWTLLAPFAAGKKYEDDAVARRIGFPCSQSSKNRCTNWCIRNHLKTGCEHFPTLLTSFEQRKQSRWKAAIRWESPRWLALAAYMVVWNIPTSEQQGNHTRKEAAPVKSYVNYAWGQRILC